MKKLIRFTFVAMAACVLYFGVSSCEEGISPLLIDVELNYDKLVLKIDSGAAVSGEVSALDTTISANIDSLVESAGGSVDDIKKLFVEGFSLKLIKPVGGNFDAIKSISLSVATAANPSDIMQIVSPDSIFAKGVSELVVPVTDEDIVRLLQDDKFVIKASIILEEGVELTEGLVAEGTLMTKAKVSPL
jgi:hypothetical protein